MFSWAVLALIVLFVVCQIPELGRVTSLRRDETYYIQGAYTMTESGLGELDFRAWFKEKSRSLDSLLRMSTETMAACYRPAR